VVPARMTTNAGARPGDTLVLTKPLGSGVIATAIKKGEASEAVVAGAVSVMATLNRGAAEAMSAAGVSGATDVTGFGLLGHLHRMLAASGVSARVRAADVPILEGARSLAEAGHVPGGTVRNLADLAEHVVFADEVDEVTRTLLADAQTSGGLLIAAPVGTVEGLVAELEGKASVAAVVGVVEEGRPGRIDVS